MSAKHTPGPWHVTFGHKTKLARGIHAATRNVVNFNGLAAPASAESQANASLIAAAPDLLKLLNDFVTDFRVTTNDDIRAYVAEARAAIAKATGEQQ